MSGRCVFFDVDGVLVHGYHARPEKQVRWDVDLLADLGVDPDRFRDEFIYGSFVKQVLVGRLSLLEALDKALPALGYKGSSMAFVGYWLAHDSTVNRPLLDVVRLLGTHADCRLLIATNQDHMRAQWLWMTLGFGELFDDIFHSARVGALKPTAPYFEWVARRIGPQTVPPLFFDDREDVVKGARAHGWESVLFNDIEDVRTHPFVAQRLAAA